MNTLRLEESSPPPTCELFIGILSSPSSRERRTAIRETWLKSLADSGLKMRYLFVVGRTTDSNEERMIEEEGHMHGDIARLPFLDTYYNLTIKTSHLLRLPESQGCPLLVKCDDDVYIHSKNFLALLPGLPTEKLYAGHILISNSPIREWTSKWYLSLDDYPGDSFPPYAEGPLYFLSTDIARILPYQLLPVSSTKEVVPTTYLQNPRSPLFRFEDVFIGWLMAELPEKDRPYYKTLPFLYSQHNSTKHHESLDDDDDDDSSSTNTSSSSSTKHGKLKSALVSDFTTKLPCIKENTTVAARHGVSKEDMWLLHRQEKACELP